VVPDSLTGCEFKWLIARSDWFCGTRMHACIAALSSGVPTAAVAYSDKTLGVFETCGQGGEVVDPRVCGTDEVVERLWDSYTRRDAVRGSLARHLPAVLSKANEQMNIIAAYCLEVAGRKGATGTEPRANVR
jgi:polysaccharide pyruvyl transferase WcaK-like protein